MRLPRKVSVEAEGPQSDPRGPRKRASSRCPHLIILKQSSFLCGHQEISKGLGIGSLIEPPGKPRPSIFQPNQPKRTPMVATPLEGRVENWSVGNRRTSNQTNFCPWALGCHLLQAISSTPGKVWNDTSGATQTRCFTCEETN